MSYTVALTKSGQMTLPKALRVFLGVDGAKSVRIEQKKDGIEIKRKMTHEELRALFDANISEETRRIMEEDRKKGITTVSQIKAEMAKDPRIQEKLRRKYGG